MSLIDLGGTAHFVVRHDPAVAGADACALAVLGTCEQDLVRCSRYLPYAADGGADRYLGDHRIAVHVVDLVANRGGPNNSAGGPARPLCTIDLGAINRAGRPISDDFARFLFVAELAKVLMPVHGFDPHDGRGEALSRVLAQELYPALAQVPTEAG
jgi:hypothetical protein